MARTNSDDLLMEDDLAAAFLNGDDEFASPITEEIASVQENIPGPGGPIADEWEDNIDELPGQLAVDVYETNDKLVIKARTAGISKSELDVSLSKDNILTITGILTSGNDDEATRWHMQECYWGEFSRQIALPVQVQKDDKSVKAELKDGVLTITFDKEKTEAPQKIEIV